MQCSKYLEVYVTDDRQMTMADGQSVRYCLITESTVGKNSEAQYFSRGQKYLFEQRLEEEDGPVRRLEHEEEWEGEEDEKVRVYG